MKAQVDRDSMIKIMTNNKTDVVMSNYLDVKIIRGTTNDGKPWLALFSGRQSKPYVNYRYRTYEAREEAIKGYKKSAKSHYDYKEKRKEERKAKPSINVGDVYHDMWGWEQTNNTFYEVVEKASDHFAIVREIGYSYRGSGSFMSGYSKCIPGHYVGDPFRVKVTKDGDMQRIKVRGYSSATLLKDIEHEFIDTNYA